MRERRPHQQLVAQDLLPEVLNQPDLREEAMAADVEAVAIVGVGARDPAHDVVALQHHAGVTEPR